MNSIYHVSEEKGIGRFEPRPSPERSGVTGDFVWGIDEAHLAHYLLPREAPRVTFRRSATTTAVDAARLLGPAAPAVVIAVESGWMERMIETGLVLYRFDPAPFSLHDPIAGYWLSAEPVVPLEERYAPSSLALLLQQPGVELRVMESLWPLYHQVIASSLDFSIIRMRNAQPEE